MHSVRTLDPNQRDEGAVLMLAYQRGDETAFDRLVELYSGQLYALLTRFLGNQPAREDLLQEVFLRVIRARDRYRPSARFSTWLYRIAFNLCVNEKQRGGSRGVVSLDGAVDEGGQALDPQDVDAPPPSEKLESDDVVSAVRYAIDSLPPTQRMALVLAKYEGLPYAQIADVMDSSEKAIKSLIHRARENLRDRLRPFLQEEFA